MGLRKSEISKYLGLGYERRLWKTAWRGTLRWGREYLEGELVVMAGTGFLAAISISGTFGERLIAALTGAAAAFFVGGFLMLLIQYALAPIELDERHAKARRRMHERWNQAIAYERGRRQFGAIRSALGNIKAQLMRVQNACVVGNLTDDQLRAEFKHWSELAQTFVEQYFDKGEASLLVRADFPDIDANAQALINAGQNNRSILYLNARDMARALEQLIEASRPLVSDTANSRTR